MGTTGVYYLYTWTYYNGYVFPDIYIGSIDLNAGKIVDASGNEITFQIGGFSGGGNTDPSEEEVVFMNNGYPYGKNMTNSSHISGRAQPVSVDHLQILKVQMEVHIRSPRLMDTGTGAWWMVQPAER